MKYWPRNEAVPCDELVAALVTGTPEVAAVRSVET
jgi:hypothetical protein